MRSHPEWSLETHVETHFNARCQLTKMKSSAGVAAVVGVTGVAGCSGTHRWHSWPSSPSICLNYYRRKNIFGSFCVSVVVPTFIKRNSVYIFRHFFHIRVTVTFTFDNWITVTWGHCDLDLWPPGTKIYSAHVWVQVNVCTKFEDISSSWSWDITSIHCEQA